MGEYARLSYSSALISHPGSLVGYKGLRLNDNRSTTSE